jgi:DNA processing protein
MEYKMNNKMVLVALNQVSGIGPRTIQRILQHWPDLKVFVREVQRQQLSVKLPHVLTDAVAQLNWAKVEKELLWAEQKNCHILTILDSNYPHLLRQLPDAPPVLYCMGNIETLHQQLLAIVGSRHPSAYGQQVAKQWSEVFCQHGLVLVSGMAIGIDTLVHQSCLKFSKQTIAVLGSGLKRIYPKSNQLLAEQIPEKGLLISEFSLETSPNPRHFPRRNRIISGLALCTLIVEAAEKSGTMHTAQHAVEQNREVFAIPGHIFDNLSRGCHLLIQQGARLALSEHDILAEYGQIVPSYTH